ncbi:MAG: AzlC family ABC transporter permease [Chloroflexi bacterium]|nr:MAG: AzlC family ABC transporter permease [Chloroflexota bacterium]
MTPARAAIAEGWPVLLTSVVVGITYGVVARQSGLSVAEASGSSLLVFAGAAQFAAVGLLREGAGTLEVAASVLLINLRHLLMAASLRPHFARASLVERLGLGYILTDEAFAVGIGHFRRGHGDLVYYATFGTLLWLCWNIGTLAGAIFGAGLEHPERYGIDFAITATFLAIVAVGVRHRTDLVVAVAAGIVAGALRLVGATTLAVVVAGAVAPIVVLLARDEPGETAESAFRTR